jgi:hypothetical protein
MLACHLIHNFLISWSELKKDEPFFSIRLSAHVQGLALLEQRDPIVCRHRDESKAIALVHYKPRGVF